MSQIAKLGGFALPNTAEAGWTFTSGTRPDTRIFHLTAEQAHQLVARSDWRRPIELEVIDQGYTGEQGRTLTHTDLYALHVVPANIPDLLGVLVADRRTWWSRRHVLRRYNLRRNSGDRRHVSSGQAPQLAETFPDVIYAPFSLSPSGAAWTASEIILDMVRAVDGSDPIIDAGGLPSESLPIEGLEIDDAGDTAIGRALSHLPGAALYIGTDGRVHLYNSRSIAAEIRVLSSTGPSVVGFGLVAQSSFDVQRPEKIRVLFTPQYDVRIDAWEEDAEVRPEDDRAAENVLPIPDHTARVATSEGVEELAGGTWISMELAIAAFNDLLERSGVGTYIKGSDTLPIPPLTRRSIREGLVWPPGLLQIYVGLGELVPHSQLAGWIAAFQQHFRRTYRIAPRLMDRVLSIRDRLAAVTDPENGIQARAQVYQSYCQWPTQRGMIASEFASALAVNCTSHPIDEGDPLGSLASGRVAPATVSILDGDLGIYQISFHTDVYGLIDRILPSLVDDMPKAPSVTNAGARTVDEARQGSSSFPALTKDFHSSVVVSMTPGAPNDESQLYPVDVTPEMVRQAYPLLEGIGPGRGPTWQIRISPGLTAARMAWLDATADLTDIGLGLAGTPIDDAMWEALKVLNVNRAELEAVATAAAASVYARLADRPLGGKAIRMRPDIVPAGGIASVAHRLAAGGDALTFLALPEEREAVDPVALLDAGTKKTILHLVQDRK